MARWGEEEREGARAGSERWPAGHGAARGWIRPAACVQGRSSSLLRPDPSPAHRPALRQGFGGGRTCAGGESDGASATATPRAGGDGGARRAERCRSLDSRPATGAGGLTRRGPARRGAGRGALERALERARAEAWTARRECAAAAGAHVRELGLERDARARAEAEAAELRRAVAEVALRSARPLFAATAGGGDAGGGGGGGGGDGWVPVHLGALAENLGYRSCLGGVSALEQERIVRLECDLELARFEAAEAVARSTRDRARQQQALDAAEARITALAAGRLARGGGGGGEGGAGGCGWTDSADSDCPSCSSEGSPDDWADSDGRSASGQRGLEATRGSEDCYTDSDRVGPSAGSFEEDDATGSCPLGSTPPRGGRGGLAGRPGSRLRLLLPGTASDRSAAAPASPLPDRRRSSAGSNAAGVSPDIFRRRPVEGADSGLADGPVGAVLQRRWSAGRSWSESALWRERTAALEGDLQTARGEAAEAVAQSARERARLQRELDAARAEAALLAQSKLMAEAARALEQAAAADTRVAADLALASLRKQMEEESVRHQQDLMKQGERLKALEDGRLAVAALLAQEQAEVQRLRDLLAKANAAAASHSTAAEQEATAGGVVASGPPVMGRRERSSARLDSDDADATVLQREVRSLRAALAHSERLRSEAERARVLAMADAGEERSSLEKQCAQLQSEAGRAWQEASVYISRIRSDLGSTPAAQAVSGCGVGVGGPSYPADAGHGGVSGSRARKAIGTKATSKGMDS